MAELPLKVTHEAYWQFLREFGAGKYPTLRLGQASMGHMISWKEPHPELFYANDEAVATALIEARYLEPLTS